MMSQNMAVSRPSVMARPAGSIFSQLAGGAGGIMPLPMKPPTSSGPYLPTPFPGGIAGGAAGGRITDGPYLRKLPVTPPPPGSAGPMIPPPTVAGGMGAAWRPVPAQSGQPTAPQTLDPSKMAQLQDILRQRMANGSIQTARY